MTQSQRQQPRSLRLISEELRRHFSAQWAEALAPLREGARVELSNIGFSIPERVDPENFYAELATRVRNQDFVAVDSLADEYRTHMEDIGKLRRGSSRASAKRRMQEILQTHVYGVRVPEDELTQSVREGRLTGGSRLPTASEFSDLEPHG